MSDFSVRIRNFKYNLVLLRAGPQLLQGPNGALVERSLQTAKPNLYVLPDCLYTIPASKPCSGPNSVACSIPGQCTANQLPGGCCQVGFKCTCVKSSHISVLLFLLLFLHAIPPKRGKVRSADKLQVEGAKFLPLVGLARSNPDPINRGHGAQYLYRPSPAGAQIELYVAR